MLKNQHLFIIICSLFDIKNTFGFDLIRDSLQMSPEEIHVLLSTARGKNARNSNRRPTSLPDSPFCLALPNSHTLAKDNHHVFTRKDNYLIIPVIFNRWKKLLKVYCPLPTPHALIYCPWKLYRWPWGQQRGFFIATCWHQSSNFKTSTRLSYCISFPLTDTKQMCFSLENVCPCLFYSLMSKSGLKHMVKFFASHYLLRVSHAKAFCLLFKSISSSLCRAQRILASECSQMVGTTETEKVNTWLLCHYGIKTKCHKSEVITFLQVCPF